MDPVTVSNNNEPEQQVTPVTLLELKQLYQECLETAKPGLLDLLRIVQVSVNDDNVKQCMDLLLTNAELQSSDTNRHLVELQVGMRLALLASCRTFRKLHYELVCKRANSKKMRKQTKQQTPQQVLERQLLNLFSLLAIKSDTPTNFQSLVKELVTTTCAPQDLITLIYDFFELNEEEEEVEEEGESTVAVVPRTEPKWIALIPQKEEEEEPKIINAKEYSLIGQSISLTASIRKNKLVPDQKRKYVGSHFNTKLSNVSTLFRQVTVPIQRKKSEETTKKLEEERPVKKPRVAFNLPPPKKQVLVSETPAKRHSQPTLSPMGPDSQNAFLVAREALAARRKR
jgi:hypothetical protein